VIRDPAILTDKAAAFLADEARRAIVERGRFIAAFSGGSTPWRVLQALAGEDLPWEAVHIVQVDERVAPEGSAERNLTHLRESLLNRVPILPDHIHAMPVEDADLEAAAARYAQKLTDVTGKPPVLDLIHLGLGSDGHTASLVPGDPALDIAHADVATTGLYQGTRRMTLTYPIINRARQILWLVTGAEKADMLVRLVDEDESIPAGRVRGGNALVLADHAAAQKLDIDVALEVER
jgi:6-phosphogluconolactonase